MTVLWCLCKIFKRGRSSEEVEKMAVMSADGGGSSDVAQAPPQKCYLIWENGQGIGTKSLLWQSKWRQGVLFKHNYQHQLLESKTLGIGQGQGNWLTPRVIEMGTGIEDQIPNSGDWDRNKGPNLWLWGWDSDVDEWPNPWKLNKINWEGGQRGELMVQRFPWGAHLTNLPHSHKKNQID